MKLGYTIIYVQDVLKTIDFYQKAFSLTLKFLHESAHYAEMDTGETTLAFASEELAKMNGLCIQSHNPRENPSGFELAFVTPNIKKAYETALKGGAQSILPPTQKPWDQTVSYVADLNGILIEICSPLQP